MKESSHGLDGSAAAAGGWSRKEADVSTAEDRPVGMYKNGEHGATDICNSDSSSVAFPGGVWDSMDGAEKKAGHTKGGEAAPASKVTRRDGSDNPAAAAAAAANNRHGGRGQDHVGENEGKY